MSKLRIIKPGLSMDAYAKMINDITNEIDIKLDSETTLESFVGELNSRWDMLSDDTKKKIEEICSWGDKNMFKVIIYINAFPVSGAINNDVSLLANYVYDEIIDITSDKRKAILARNWFNYSSCNELAIDGTSLKLTKKECEWGY